MFDALKKEWRFARLNAALRDVVTVPPIACRDDAQVACVTHLGRKYLYMYLLAIKSLARSIPLRKIVIIDDLSLGTEHKALLQKQIVGIDIRPITSVPNTRCPSGGDWEGFLLIGDECARSYCILLDADVVVKGDIPEVVRCVEENRSFTLGTWKDQDIVSVAEAYEHVKRVESQHVQILAERKLRDLPGAESLKYVRGCGGFAGFARGRPFRSDIEEFSHAIAQLVGVEKWNDWGSQQIASNFLVANMPGAVVLPFPKYASMGPNIDVRKSSFIHFIGSNRFDGNHYFDVGASVIEGLKS